MKIKYVGHSCFVLTSDKGTSIVTDPFGDIGLDMPRIRANAVTVSHNHYDHNRTDCVDASAVFDSEGEFRAGDVRICSFKSYHDEVHGRKRGENLIFKFWIDGYTVCHLGDLGENCEKRIVDAIADADVLLLPVGGTYTIDAEQAAEYVRVVAPKYAIPMHYYVAGLQVDIAPPDGFLNCFKKEEIMYIGNEFDPATVEQNYKIIVMERL